MKTRGKNKFDTNPNDLSKDPSDFKDFLEDNLDSNRSFDDKSDYRMEGYPDSKLGRNGTTRPPSRTPRGVDTRTRREKQLIESVEFQEVVKGFAKFIEDLNRRKKPSSKKLKESAIKPYRHLEDTGNKKKLKLDIEPTPNQLSEKFEPLQTEGPPTEVSKVEKAVPGRKPALQQPAKVPPVKEDIKGREVGGLEREEAKKYQETAYPKGQERDQKAQNWQKEAQVNAVNPYEANLKMMMNTSRQQEFNNPLAVEQQQNKAMNIYDYDYGGMLRDIAQRIQLQNMTNQNPLLGYMQPYGLGGFGGDLSNDLMMNYHLLENVLQKYPQNLLGSLLASTQGTAALLGALQQEQQPSISQNMGLVGNNKPLGFDLNDPNAISSVTFAKTLGKAAIHGAIAYSIFYKSMDPEVIAKGDMSKLDPTYNARVLKEKKYKGFVSDNSMVSRLMAAGYQNRQENSAQKNALEAQNVQENVVRKQQEVEQRKQGGEGEKSAQKAKQTPVKDQEIIEINDDDDSGVEIKGESEMKIEVKSEKGNPPVEE